MNSATGRAPGRDSTTRPWLLPDVVRRAGLAALVVTFAAQALEWGEWLVLRVPDGLRRMDLWDYRWGADSAFLQAGGLLMRRGGEALYSPTAIARAIVDVGSSAEPGSRVAFAYPPPTAQLATLISGLAPFLAWLVVAVGGAALAIVALRRIGATWRFVGLAFLFVPVAWAFRLGQLSLLATAIIATIAALEARGSQQVLAGMAAGLLVIKPQYGIGVALFWLVDWRRHGRAIVSGAATAGAIVVASAVASPEAWSDYLHRVSRTTEALQPADHVRHVGLAAFGRLVAGPTAGWVLLALGTLAAVVLLRRALPGIAASDSLALSLVAGILISPYFGDYDLTILLVPAVILWAGHPARRTDLTALFGLVALAVFANRPVAFATVLWTGGRTLLLAPPALAAASWIAWRICSRDDGLAVV